MSALRSSQIASAYANGMATNEIKAEYGCSSSSIQRAIKKHGVPARAEAQSEWNEGQRSALEQLWTKTSKSTSEIARDMNMTKGAVIGAIHRFGYKRPEALSNLRKATHPPGPKAKPKEAKAPPKKRGPKPKPKYDPETRTMTKAPDPKTTIPDISGLVVGSLARPWAGRQVRECNWPVSGEGADTVYCCAPVKTGSWCEEHRSRGKKDFNGRGAYSEPKFYVDRMTRLSRF